MQALNFNEIKNFKGWLDKKSPSLMAGWQSRFFRIIEGKFILYSEQENDNNPKGHIQFNEISQAEPAENTVFKFALNGRDFILKAKDIQTRDKWVNIINYLISYNKKNKTDNSSPAPASEEDLNKDNKMNTLDKSNLELLKNEGLLVSKSDAKSKELLEKKGITSMINIENPDIQSRIFYGFLFKHHTAHDNAQKRWFFIISSRPLNDIQYEKDDISLKEQKLSLWMKFDCLFYFKYKNEDENTGPLSFLSLSDCHMIDSIDKDGKYYLILDVEDRKYEIYSEIKGERDKWFEVLKNSRRTAKEVRASISKHPRNMQKLDNLLKQSPDKLQDELNNEITKTVGDYKQMYIK